MFAKEFFETSFNDHVAAKRKYSPDGNVTVRFHLATGETVKVFSIEEAGDGYLVLEVYPHRGEPRRYPKEERQSGAPPADFDRIALPYSQIQKVEISTERPHHGRSVGYRPAR